MDFGERLRADLIPSWLDVISHKKEEEPGSELGLETDSGPVLTPEQEASELPLVRRTSAVSSVAEEDSFLLDNSAEVGVVSEPKPAPVGDEGALGVDADATAPSGGIGTEATTLPGVAEEEPLGLGPYAVEHKGEGFAWFFESVRRGGRVAVEGLGRIYTAEIPSWVAYSGIAGVLVLLGVLGAVKLSLFDQRTHEAAPVAAMAVPAGSAGEWAQTLDHIVGTLAVELDKLKARVDIHGRVIDTQGGRIEALSGRVDEVAAGVRATTPVKPGDVLEAFRKLQKQKELQGQKPSS